MNNIVPDGFGSTFLSPIINNYADLVYRCKSLLGFPIQNDELTDAQWAVIIDEVALRKSILFSVQTCINKDVALSLMI